MRMAAATNWAPLLIFAAVVLSNSLCALVSRFLRRRKPLRAEEQLQLEIRDLKKQANVLSTPSTFAKAAKLKRAAAMKEKELAQLKADGTKHQGLLRSLHTFLPVILKALIYLTISFWFWESGIASVPSEIISPFNNALSWRNSSNNMDAYLKIGVVPWLVVCVSIAMFLENKFLSI